MAMAAEQHGFEAPDLIDLDHLPLGESAYIVELRAAVAGGGELLRRLQELGFMEGEPVRVVARGSPGGTPLAVRIGSSTFALRRYEAKCIWVTRASSGIA